MLITLSPSKGQDFDNATPSDIHDIPRQLDDSALLIKEARKYNTEGVQELMQVSEKIASLNVDRFKTWETPFTVQNAKASLYAFTGDVYAGIEKHTFNDDDLNYAQDHLRILSGLYGVLRPMDLIQPYRLEMKTSIENPRGKNLYQFWGDKITELLNKDMVSQQEAVLVNLASNEYFKSVKPKLLNGRLLNITFKETKGDKTRVVAIYAKRARGMMADYILRNRIEKSEDIKAFDTAGYQYNEEQSTENNWVFTRLQPEPKKK